MLPFLNTPKKSRFIWVTRDHSGLGFAKHSVEEVGIDNVLYTVVPKDDEDNFECLELVGNGIVNKIEWDELWKNRKEYQDWLWIWDGNFSPELNEQLRKEGFSVFGGSQLQYDMENDRKFGMDIVKKAGLETLPYEEFSSPEEGIEYLESNPDKAYVFKPDSGSGCYTTYVPDNEDDAAANEELRRYMTALDDDGTTYILQERIRGIEHNVEVWVKDGKAFFAFADLECKRKLNKDEGEMVGCSQDIAFTIPLDAKVLENTIYKVLALIPGYEGFFDMNIISKDRKDYFIEFCARWGYNSHPNLIWNLAISPLTTILSDFMAGDIDDFYRHFRYGFGASVTLYIDHEKKGLPFEKESDIIGHFYHFDSRRDEEGNYSLCGYGNEVGVVCAHGFTIKEAAKEALRIADKIHYPMHAMRTDLGENDYPLAPQGRYEGLQSMRYFDKGN